MVNLLREDQVKRLSPESRVKNSYEAMYYKVNSGDPEMDEIVKAEIQDSFRKNGLILTDNPDKEQLREVMLDAYKSSTSEFQKSDLNPEQVESIERDFDKFTANHERFYDTSFKSFEKIYKGEPVDISADYDRMVQDNGGVDPYNEVPDIDEIEKMAGEFEEAKNLTGRSGLSYEGHVPAAVAAQILNRTYEQVKQEEAVAAELKGDDVDKGYDDYARNHANQAEHAKFTAGDAYGYDERKPVPEPEHEDEGPEL